MPRESRKQGTSKLSRLVVVQGAQAVRYVKAFKYNCGLIANWGFDQDLRGRVGDKYFLIGILGRYQGPYGGLQRIMWFGGAGESVYL